MFKEKMLLTNVYEHHDKMARTKTNTQRNTKHVGHQKATYIQKKLFLCGSVL